jgi:HlyD family secretion protein
MKTKRRKKILFASAAVAVLCVAVLLLTMRDRSSSDDLLLLVQVERGDIEISISATGTMEAVGTVEVGTQVSGTVDQVLADFNDRVEKGQILAVLDTTVLSASVQESEANLIKARAQHELSTMKYEDAEELFKMDYISETEFQTVRADFETSRAALLSAELSLSRAEANLRYAVIRSPIRGTVIHRAVEPGQTVAASFSTPTLFVIAEDLSQMEIHAYVDESDIGGIEEGQTVRFTVESYPEDTFFGVTKQIRLQPETISNVVNYTVVVSAENPGGRLLPGMTATADFIIEQREDVLLVDGSALSYTPSVGTLEKMASTMVSPASHPMDSLMRPPRMENQQIEEASAENPLISPEADRGVLWYMDDEGTLRPMPVRVGVTDGKRIEILDVFGVEEGMEFATGSTSSLGLMGSSPSQGNRGPRPPRLF